MADNNANKREYVAKVRQLQRAQHRIIELRYGGESRDDAIKQACKEHGVDPRDMEPNQ